MEIIEALEREYGVVGEYERGQQAEREANTTAMEERLAGRST